jgi:hypothetical protein
MTKHNLKVPTFIAVFVLLVGVVAGIALIQSQQSVQTSASVEKAPYNVTVSNIQDDSFTVTWTTDTPTVGFILWGKDATPVTPAQSMGGGSKEVHMVKVKSLEPSTEYLFTITSGGTEYKDSGKPWGVSTGPGLGMPEKSKVISGSVEDKDGEPVPFAVVTVSAEGMTTLTAMTSSTGSWVVPLSLARTPDLTEYANISDNKLEITVLTGNQGKATAVVHANVEGTLPPIVIGHSHDFTNLTSVVDRSSPEAQLALPDGEVEKVQGISDSSVVTLESVDNGEVVFTAIPEFFGDGPPGSEISITVHSDPVSGTAQVKDDGQWEWAPPKTLENGLHNITLEWIDTQGIVHTLTRSFIVQAQEGEPAFESTPSGTTSASASPRPTATATARPTASPSPRATVKPTLSPSPSGTPKGGNLPDAGIVTPSVLLGAAGFATLSLGAFLALKNK